MRAAIISVILLSVSVGPLLLRAPAALACSVPPSYDRLGASDVIIEGRITGWSRLPKPSPGGGVFENYIPILVQIDVAKVHKGTSTSEFVDTASLYDGGSGELWAGHAVCGAFIADPTGLYVIFGMRLEDDGTYQSDTILSFFEGEGPSGQAYEDAVRLVSPSPTPTPAPSQPVVLPVTGGGADRNVGSIASGFALAFAGLLIAAVGFRPHRWRG